MLGNSFSVWLLSIWLKFISLWLYRKSIFTTLRFSTVKANNLNAAAKGREIKQVCCVTADADVFTGALDFFTFSAAALINGCI